jgi:hypothetical protein
MTRPDGRGTLPLGVLRPKYGLEYERDDDMFGTVLWAVVVARLTLPSDGRGTERDIGDFDGVAAPDLVLEGSASDRTPFCGGRGTLWFIAICAGCDGAFRLDIAGLLTP